MIKKLLLIVFTVIVSFPAISQTDFKTWASAGINFSLSKRLGLRLNYLTSYNMSDNFINTFSQSSASFSYNVSKRFSTLGGAMITRFPSDSDPTYRYFVRVSYKLPVAHLVTWSNGIQAEQHSLSETRFRNRIIYITRFSNSKRFDFLNLSLSASYWLFYNMGGNRLRYFEKTGEVVARNTPDGFHRGRLYLTANSKVTDNFSVSLYYMHQQEFNLFSNQFRQINVTNPSTGRISRAFDNYNVTGVSLFCNLDLYQNSKHKSSSKHKK